MKPLSYAASEVRASTTLAIDSLAKKLKSEGADIVGFGTGEPDFQTPDNIRAAGIRAIEKGLTKYTPAAGTESLRRAVCKRFKEDFDLDYDFTQVVVASGAKHNVYVALAAITNPGDEIILPAPYWVTYYESIKMTGGVPVEIYAGESAQFKITASQLEGAITDKTKALILNNPSNPTGMLYSRDELAGIAEVCKKHDIYVISDEIYYRLVYDGKEFVSFASLSEDAKERTIIINGVSKSYAMTGWRIGYALANKQIAKVMANFLSHSTSAPSTISQYAAEEALLGDQESVEEMRKVFEQRRNHIVKRVNSMEYVSCLNPDGAFYIMMNVEKLVGKTIAGTYIKDGDDFAMALLEKEGVAVVPCSGFGAPNYLRWTYAASMEDIDKGLDRLEKFLKDVEK
ncbi:MAG TPA: pyridoxal phosphate-dependent aminotransferase [Clostridiales bacterium]|jgi:aspartate aminotransferase|nr:pyridoxal phosphate-dependent aminotransferase [Clostridiales bacterium]